MFNKVIKRFYTQAAAAETGDGFAVRLDGRAVKTPAGKVLVVPTRALAEAVAAEWAAQGETVRPADMPLTQLAATALDRIGPERDAILAQLLAYAGTDLLCHRAGFPPDLVRRQHAAWQPVLDWAAAELGARLEVTAGVVAVPQPADSLAALAARLAGYDVWRLTAVQAAAPATGSLVLALALAQRRLSGAEAFDLSHLDETYQMERWGDDPEAAQRRANLRRDVLAADRLLALV
jgi:chaperone required for assembly of F1-ATPase